MIKAMIVVMPTASTIDLPRPPDRFRLTCTGTMQGADPLQPESPIMTNGTVDLAGRRVYGFGIGSEAIVRVSDREIGFGSARMPDGPGSMFMEGTIGRVSGAVDITVRSPRNPHDRLISMHLDCRTVRPLF